jgi:hypothetical protein
VKSEVYNLYFILRGPERSIGIATRYGREDRKPAGTRFSAPVQTGSVAHPASYTMGTGSFTGVKRPERGVEHPPPSSAESKERLEL